MKRRVLVQVDEGTHERWKAKAFSEGRSMSEIARELLERALEVSVTPRAEVVRRERVLSSSAAILDVVSVRPHMKKNRPAVECPSRVFEGGFCVECGAAVA